MEGNSHGGDGGAWSEIRRRKPSHYYGHHANITSLYISNVPDGVSNQDLRDLFQPFGTVVDIYISRRRNKAGYIFSFVKFTGITDEKAFEASLPKITCRNSILDVNLERYPRKPSSIPHSRPNLINLNHKSTPAYQNHSRNPHPQPSYLNRRDGRSYAHAVGGHNHFNRPPVLVEKVQHMVDFSNSKANLFGSALSVDHLRDLPALLEADGVPRVRVYYTGGLGVALCFLSSAGATAFLEDDSRWRKWLKDLITGPNMPVQTEFVRLVWLKIRGLPLMCRSQENITIIGNLFGTLLESQEITWDCADMSQYMVCVLTNRRKMINEETTISCDGKLFEIGVVESEIKWSPFKHQPTDVGENNEGVLDDEEDDDDDGVSDTDDENTHTGEDNMEDGEITPEKSPTPTPVAKAVEQPNVQHQEDNNEKAQTEPLPSSSMAHNSNPGTQPISPPFPKPTQPITFLNSPSPSVSTSKTNTKARPSLKPRFKVTARRTPRHSPLGSFRNGRNNLSPSPIGNRQTGKRRRLHRSDEKSPTPTAPTSPPNPTYVHPIDPSPPPTAEPSIDLNRTSSPCSSGSHVADSPHSPSHSEASNTAKIGMEVGFQIDVGNRILEQVLRGKGESIIPQ